MLRLINLSILIFFVETTLNSQSVDFYPEITLGNRSAVYQHFVEYQFNNQWSINNISLFDTEYNNDKNNIYFIRNMLSYRLNTHFKTNAAVGIKNPGAFASLNSQYLFTKSNFRLSYAIGSTYQNGFTLEQTFHLNYSPKFNKEFQVYINLLIVVNTDLKVLDRGIQQLRFGIKNQNLITGIAANLDQFAQAKKKLENFGIFIKYNF